MNCIIHSDCPLRQSHAGGTVVGNVTRYVIDQHPDIYPSAAAKVHRIRNTTPFPLPKYASKLVRTVTSSR